MESFKKIILLSWTAVFTLHGPLALEEKKSFVLQPSPTMGSSRLSIGWTDRSLLSCMVRCTIRHSTTCQSFMYNHLTKSCTPGQWLDQSQPVPTPDEGDLYVMRNESRETTVSGTQQVTSSTPITTKIPVTSKTPSTTTTPVTTCGDSKFLPQDFASETVCMAYVETLKNYTEAEIYCQSKNSHLYSMRTLDRFYAVRTRIRHTVWIGLDDTATEGTFKWKDKGDDLDPSTNFAMFDAGQLANTGTKDCVSMSISSLKLQVEKCGNQHYFICGKNV